jgi:hypothetical protein
MSNETLRLTEGWTTPIEYKLLHEDPETGELTVPEGLADMTPSLVLKDKDGNAIDTSSDVEWADAANGIVRYNPDATALTAAKSPFTAKFKVTDASSKIAYFPQGEPLIWRVYAP